MERLSKVLAHAGVASRRKAEELIANGHVKVNGAMINAQGMKISSADVVEVDGIPISKENKVYFLFYKPRGVITSVSDELGRKTVMDFFVHVKERIYPIGRLDWDTSGVLLLTNDGEFAHQMMHPSHEIEKVYAAKVEGLANKENLRPLTKGVKIDGIKMCPARYEIIQVDSTRKISVVRLTIHEGRNHQVKKMFSAVGLPVQKLRREVYGGLDVKGLRPGEYRALNKKEINLLKS
ncbi:MAG: rRNA pseudouridine synthase [Lactobacillales bacterium]|nr:rRNA pseudouridine synthase [Lactobacillales bacterium]